MTYRQLLVSQAIWFAGLPAFAHPVTVYDQAGLARLRSLRNDSAHAALTAFASQFVAAQGVAHQGSCPAAISGNPNGQVGGYAVLAEILQQNVSDAVTYLNCFCAQTWLSDADIDEAAQLSSAAIAYDVLYNEGGIAASCQSRISTAAGDFYKAFTDTTDSRGWWRDDIANNHLWVNMAALGVAAEALNGEDPNAQTWLAAVDQAFQKIAAVQDYSTDGSWHEGDGYQFFAMEEPAFYHLGAARAGNPDRSATQLYLNAGKYFLQRQKPNDGRFLTSTPGDFNWVRPGFVAVMRFIGGHFGASQPTLAGYAQAAAERWDLIPRATQTFWLNRFEFVQDYALEYVSFDETVAALDPASTLPLANYNDNEGSFIVRSSWGAATTGPDSTGLVITLKNGYPSGKGMAQATASCANIPSAGSGWYDNFGHDHFDNFGLYLFGNGGWLLPESAGYNCCGNDAYGSDRDAYHDSYYHNTVTFDGSLTSNGNGQILDDWIATRGSNGSGVSCGNTSDVFFTIAPSNPIHDNTAHFAIGVADGTHLYRNVALSTALRTVGFDRETNVIVLSDQFAFSTGSHTIQQHFHSMKGSTSLVDSNGWLMLDDSTAPGPQTVQTTNTVLAIRVLAPSDAASTFGVQPSADGYYQEWMSPDGNFGHFAVATSGPVTQARFLDFLWPTDTASYATKPDAAALDTANPDRGLQVPLTAGGTEAWIINVLGTATSAGPLTLAGGATTDVAAVRYDASGNVLRAVVEGVAGGKLQDQNGSRTLLDLAGNVGTLEVAFTSGSADLTGTAAIDHVQFHAATHPGAVTQNGNPVAYSYDPSQQLVTISPSGATAPDAGVLPPDAGGISADSGPPGKPPVVGHCGCQTSPDAIAWFLLTPLIRLGKRRAQRR